ncbi:class I SAM-dependent methyltransferase [Isoptericola croceus]|uniref:class I SAM-dependent methyltransferase n=1 Tax=Isoptericola croceus TaxID=3031406 RepID=UPI0023F7007B|nr:class I SAM-dependent methyltransferase [Isoptericola croceus]
MNEFDHPVVAGLYDPLDPDRSDLDLYVGLAGELGARSVLDVGAGTGVLALLLAARGIETRVPAHRAWEGWTRAHARRDRGPGDRGRLHVAVPRE